MIKKIINIDFHKYLKLSSDNVKISQENTSNYYQKRLIKIFKELNAKK